MISDSLARVAAAHIALPKMPYPDPSNGKVLAQTLYLAGVNPQSKAFNVEYLLDYLVSHTIHTAVMKDIDKKFGVQADANYHVVLTQLILDLGKSS